MEESKHDDRRPLDFFRSEKNIQWLEKHIMNLHPVQRPEIRERSLKTLREFLDAFKKTLLPNGRSIKQKTPADERVDIYNDYQRILVVLRKSKKISRRDKIVKVKELLGDRRLNEDEINAIVGTITVDIREAVSTIVGKTHSKSPSIIRKIISGMKEDPNEIIQFKRFD